MAPARNGREWRNWAGDQSCRPAAVAAPANRDDLAAAVAAAAQAGRKVSVAGAGHSFTPVVETRGTVLEMRALRGVTARTVDKEPKWRHTGRKLTTGYKAPW